MPHLNPVEIARVFSQSAATYDQASILQREIGNRLFERLDLIRIAPQSILDLGSGTGYFTRFLEKRYAKASIYGVDNAIGMSRFARRKTPWFTRERFVTGNMTCLPFADQTFDFIFSNLTLHWSIDLKLTFEEIHRVLKPGGFFIFSAMGLDTLKELRDSWRKVDDYPHVNTFLDMHDLGDLLLHTGWQDPVMDMEYLTMHYGNLGQLITDLRMLGVHNHFVGKRKTLTGKARFKQMTQEYEEYRAEGRLPATYEIIYGHGWRGLDSGNSLETGEVRVSVSQIRSIR